MSDPRHRLTFWVVYDSPADYPGRYVVRAQDATPDGVEAHPTPWLVSRELAPIRQALARMGLTRIPRDPDDVPAILEMWI